MNRNFKMAPSEGISTSAWIKFFTDAGIPSNIAANYAILFTEHRITMSMLMDLNKEILHDVGITVIGDVIAILKHAKIVHEQVARDKVLETASSASPTPKRMSAASRIFNHYSRNQPPVQNSSVNSAPKFSNSAPKFSNSANSATPNRSAGRIVLKRKIEEEILPLQKSRRVLPEHEGSYKISMPSGTTAKTRKLLQQGLLDKSTKASVFKRLGSEKAVSSTTGGSFSLAEAEKQNSKGSSVFARLGPGQTMVSSTSIIGESEYEDDEKIAAPLQYRGILKTTSTPLIKNISTKKLVTRQAPSNLRTLGNQRVTSTTSVKKIITGPNAGQKYVTKNFISNQSPIYTKLVQNRLGVSLLSVNAGNRIIQRPNVTRIINGKRITPAAKSKLMVTVSKMNSSSMKSNVPVVKTNEKLIRRIKGNSLQVNANTVKKTILKRQLTETKGVFSRLGPAITFE